MARDCRPIVVRDGEDAVVVRRCLVISFHTVVGDLDHPSLGNLDPGSAAPKYDDLVPGLRPPAVTECQTSFARF